MSENQDQSIPPQPPQLPDLESPLEGLIQKPMHQMTREELTQHVQKLHSYRSSQAFYAQVRRGDEEKKEDKVKSAFEGFAAE